MTTMGQKKPPVTGRPRKPTSERAVRLVLYVEPDVAKALEKRAAKDGDRSAAMYAARQISKLVKEKLR